ncbi:hypothetical protein IJ670_02020 [bacterium]|nr:hypothetical protein [bacterium]
MDKLTELIKEARPLYVQRKRRNKILKILLFLLIPCFAFYGAMGLYIEGDELYVSFEGSKLQNELIQDDFGLMGLDN